MFLQDWRKELISKQLTRRLGMERLYAMRAQALHWNSADQHSSGFAQAAGHHQTQVSTKGHALSVHCTLRPVEEAQFVLISLSPRSYFREGSQMLNGKWLKKTSRGVTQPSASCPGSHCILHLLRPRSVQVSVRRYLGQSWSQAGPEAQDNKTYSEL